MSLQAFYSILINRYPEMESDIWMEEEFHLNMVSFNARELWERIKQIYSSITS